MIGPAPSWRPTYRKLVAADLTLSVGSVIPTRYEAPMPLREDNPVTVVDEEHGVAVDGTVVRSYPAEGDGWWVDVKVAPSSRRHWTGEAA